MQIRGYCSRVAQGHALRRTDVGNVTQGRALWRTDVGPVAQGRVLRGRLFLTDGTRPLASKPIAPDQCVHQLRESAPQFQTRLARFPRRPPRTKLLTKRNGKRTGVLAILATPAARHETRFQCSGLREMISKESFEGIRPQLTFFGERLESKRMRSRAYGKRRIGQVKQLEKRRVVHCLILVHNSGFRIRAHSFGPES